MTQAQIGVGMKAVRTAIEENKLNLCCVYSTKISGGSCSLSLGIPMAGQYIFCWKIRVDSLFEVWLNSSQSVWASSIKLEQHLGALGNCPVRGERVGRGALLLGRGSPQLSKCCRGTKNKNPHSLGLGSMPTDRRYGSGNRSALALGSPN